MANQPSQAFYTPVGDLEWVIIDGEGKDNLQGNKIYSAQVVLDKKQYAEAKKQVDDFWAANKPKGIKEPKSLGFYEHKVPTDEKDEDGDTIYEVTGKMTLQMKTGTTYADGNPKKIPVFGPKGQELSLGNKKIGNGSRGRLQGVMAIYTVTAGKKITDAGVTFYLNGVQLSKFVEYVGGPQFGAIDDEEVEDDGLDNLNDGMDALEPESSEGEGKPRL